MACAAAICVAFTRACCCGWSGRWLAGLYVGFCGAVKASISLCLFLVCVY
jgi:hypothetical protein